MRLIFNTGAIYFRMLNNDHNFFEFEFINIFRDLRSLAKETFCCPSYIYRSLKKLSLIYWKRCSYDERR